MNSCIPVTDRRWPLLLTVPRLRYQLTRPRGPGQLDNSQVAPYGVIMSTTQSPYISVDDFEQHIELLTSQCLQSANSRQWPVTIFCGAGVAAAVGLPEWSTLVAQAVDDIALQLSRAAFPTVHTGTASRTSRGRSLISNLQTYSQGIGLVAPLLPGSVEERAQIASSLAYSIAYPQSSSASRRLKIRDEVIRRAVDALIGKPPPVAGKLPDAIARALVKKNPVVKLVLTTNWDSTIEDAVKCYAGKGKPRPRVPPSVRPLLPGPFRPSTTKYPVAHLHGMLSPGSGGWPFKQPLIFSQSDFLDHTLAVGGVGGVPRWQETLVEHCLQVSTCVFIGTSLTDANYQRWLYAESKRLATTARKGRRDTPLRRADSPRRVVVMAECGLPAATSSAVPVIKAFLASRWHQWDVDVLFLPDYESVTTWVETSFA